jgi:hypothetical protein
MQKKISVSTKCGWYKLVQLGGSFFEKRKHLGGIFSEKRLFFDGIFCAFALCQA